MSFATAIRADHLSKNYKLRRERTRTLKETVLRQYAPAEQVEAQVRGGKIPSADATRDALQKALEEAGKSQPEPPAAPVDNGNK